MVRQAFPLGSLLGQTISLFYKEAEYVVTDVVADAHYNQVKGEPPLTVYVPYEQLPWRRMESLHSVVHTQGKPEAIVIFVLGVLVVSEFQGFTAAPGSDARAAQSRRAVQRPETNDAPRSIAPYFTPAAPGTKAPDPRRLPPAPAASRAD